MSPILYADDEVDDIFFMRRAFQVAGVERPLQAVHDGSEAIAYLSGAGAYSDRTQFPLPGLVLLDLNMPQMSGFEVLKWVRATPSVASLPVVVLTSSSHDSDVQRASSLGANGYLVKPGKQDELIEIVKALNSYWLMHDRLAERSSRAS